MGGTEQPQPTEQVELEKCLLQEGPGEVQEEGQREVRMENSGHRAGPARFFVADRDAKQEEQEHDSGREPRGEKHTTPSAVQRKVGRPPAPHFPAGVGGVASGYQSHCPLDQRLATDTGAVLEWRQRLRRYARYRLRVLVVF